MTTETPDHLSSTPNTDDRQITSTRGPEGDGAGRVPDCVRADDDPPEPLRGAGAGATVPLPSEVDDE